MSSNTILNSIMPMCVGKRMFDPASKEERSEIIIVPKN